MKRSQRKDIGIKAMRLAILDVPDFFSRMMGEQESILDEYIEKLCLDQGMTLADFYAEDGKVLEKILK